MRTKASHPLGPHTQTLPFGTGLPVADLTEVDLPLHSGAGEGIRVGGLVQNMALGQAWRALGHFFQGSQ
ncbi:hypothetical protein MRX96_010051 [Rhipicephalus microplus]